jgi:hypothetical protein
VLALVFAACSDTESHTGRAAQPDVPETGWRIIEVIDFNGDGFGDTLWSDPDTGRIQVSLLRGTRLLELGPALPGPEGAGWAGVSGAEFDVDGLADVCWFNPASKQAAIWLMSGTRVDERGRALPGPAGDGWAVAYTGDFDGDGLDDLLWYDATRSRALVWLMRGTCPKTVGPVLPGPGGDGWTVPSTGEFNRDGMADVLWYNTITHRIAVWLMAGAEPLERGPEIPGPPGGDWIAVTAADFDGDGISDVIWNDLASNRMAIWRMEGTHVQEVGPDVPGPAGAGWSLGSAGDTTADGMADVVWQNRRTARQMVWAMRGFEVVSRGPELPGPR